jgi:hypothetical protein
VKAGRNEHMKIQNRVLLELWNVLDRLNNKEHPVKFSYFIAKNRSRIKDNVDILMNLSRPTDDYLKYDTERVKLAKKFSDKDKNGKPIVENNQYILTENQSKFDIELEELQGKYTEEIDKAKKRNAEFNKLLDEEVEIDEFKISIDKLPEKIEARILELFMICGLILEE